MTDCKCKSHGIRRTKQHSAGKARDESLDGRKYLVVPVVMARSTVVMNDGLIPESEMLPHTWNGVAVTVDHPCNEAGENIALYTPGVVEKYDVGTIFNARVEDGDLKGEAWIDVAKAQKKFPKLIQALRGGEQIDVSTGYFCDSDPAPGVVNGVEYSEIHRNLRPEHLALLPGMEGACNWRDGCGVRNITKGKTMKVTNAMRNLAKALDAVLKTNEGDSEPDPVQMAEELIGIEDSPFTQEDLEELQGLSPKVLTALRAQFAANEDEPKEPAANEGDEPKEPAANEGDEPKEPAAARKTQSQSLRVFMSADDKAALADLRRHSNARRSELVSSIKANSTYKDSFLKALSLDQLIELESGMPKGNFFGGRPVPAQNADSDDEAVKAMTKYHGNSAIVEFRKARASK